MNKKADLALSVVAVILASVILAMYLIGIAQRECSSNRDCSDNAYCGNDYQCHEYPSKIIVQDNNYVPAALIFGIAIIVASYILKGGKIKLPKLIKED